MQCTHWGSWLNLNPLRVKLLSELNCISCCNCIQFFFLLISNFLYQKMGLENKVFTDITVWSEGFLYKVAPPELKISPIMYFVIHNSVVLSKILKIIVPFWLLFVYVDYYQNNQFYRVKIFALMAQQISIFCITSVNCGWQNT